MRPTDPQHPSHSSLRPREAEPGRASGFAPRGFTRARPSFGARLAEQSGIARGWPVVAAAFLCHCVNTGIFFYSFGVFFVALVEVEHWSRAAIGVAYSLAQVMCAIYAPIVGRLIDRRGPKLVQLCGAAIMAGGLVLLGRTRSAIEFDVVMGVLLALGSTCLGGLASNTAVASWFNTGRGRALGVATAGISMGGVVFVPLTHWLIDNLGWRAACGWLGAAVLVMVVPVVTLFMERAPALGGAGSHHLSPAEREALERELGRSVTASEAMRQGNFFLLVVALALSGAGLAVILLHQITFLTDHGIDRALASWALGATAGFGVIGKVGFGYLLDRFDQRRVAALCFALQSLGACLLLATFGPVMLVLYAMVYGFAMGGNATLQATLVADCFGRVHYAAISGRIFAFSVGFQALAVPLAGYLRDRTGSYLPVFGAVTVGTILSAIAASRLTFLQETGSDGLALR
jgi:MFS family permease